VDLIPVFAKYHNRFAQRYGVRAAMRIHAHHLPQGQPLEVLQLQALVLEPRQAQVRLVLLLERVLLQALLLVQIPQQETLSTVDVSSPSSSKTAINSPTATFSAPSATTILPTTPSSILSNSIVALSVSISASIVPLSTSSPSLTSHLASVPVSIVGESAGIVSAIAMIILLAYNKLV
jgi:hypothetical protein